MQTTVDELETTTKTLSERSNRFEAFLEGLRRLLGSPEMSFGDETPSP